MTMISLQLPRPASGSAWSIEGPGSPRSSHRHREPELNVVTAGRARYLINGYVASLTAGSMLWLLPGDEHVLIERDERMTMWIAVFKPALVKRVCASGSEKQLARSTLGDTGGVRQASVAQLRPTLTLLRRAEQLTRDPEAIDASWQRVVLADLLLTAWRTFERAAPADGAGPAPPLHPAVFAAALAIREQPDAIGTDELAQRVGLSRSRLSTLFKQQTGVTLVRYRQRQQLQRFCELQQAGSDRGLLELALEAGFGSYAQFYRVYREAFGQGPAEQKKSATDEAR